MPEFLETTVDKFTFKVATDRLYMREGVWQLATGNRVRIRPIRLLNWPTTYSTNKI
jgi:hypothetical protein